MTQHTPGPWGIFCDRDKVVTIGPSHNCTVAKMFNAPFGDHDANVWLVAAAPRMKDALFQTLKYLEKRADDESNELWAEVAAVLSEATEGNVE